MVESKTKSVLKTFQFQAITDMSSGNVLCQFCLHNHTCNPGKDLQNACVDYGRLTKLIEDSRAKGK